MFIVRRGPRASPSFVLPQVRRQLMNKYEGGSFDDFLKEEGIFEEVTEYTLKRLQILRLADIVKALIQRETAFTEKVKSESMEGI